MLRGILEFGQQEKAASVSEGRFEFASMVAD
jgi:hypothetical protein